MDERKRQNAKRGGKERGTTGSRRTGQLVQVNPFLPKTPKGPWIAVAI